jgi:hypothetical protein
MHSVRSFTVALALACIGASDTSSTEADLSPEDLARYRLIDSFVEAPFAPVKATDRAFLGWPRRSEQYLTESTLQAYFKALGVELTRSEESISDSNSLSPPSRVTWRAEGLELVGEVSGEVYLRQIEIASKLYPLNLGLRIGDPIALAYAMFGSPESSHAIRNADGRVTFCAFIRFCRIRVDNVYEATFSFDPASGGIERIRIYYPSRH